MAMYKVNGFTKWSNVISEDVAPGAIPDEITYKGYTTKNLHHSEDARRAFMSTIQRAHEGKIHDDSHAILHALKATDTYMKLNDLHLSQGAKAPDEKELAQWNQSHQEARKYLNHVGEFMHHMDYWHNHEHEIQDLMGNFTPETAGAEMADSYEPQGDQLDEELTDKTIRSGDKVKVARVIADMLGVENAESMSPDIAINTGLRKLRAKRMTPELVGVLKKMLNLAQEVGIKVDMTLIPKAVSEQAEDPPTVNKKSTYNAAKDIMRFNDFAKLSKLNKGIVPVEEQDEKDKPAADADKVDTPENIPTQVGHTLQHPADDQLRRRKVLYKTEEVNLDEDQHTADYKVNPQTGRRYRAHHIEFANSRANAEPANDEASDSEKYDPYRKVKKFPPLTKKVDEQVEPSEFSDDELDRMANEVDDIDDVLDAYDDEELKIIDDETGEEVNESVNEEALNEVLSRMERMRAKMRFLRTASKRERRLKIVLQRRSDAKTLNKRARRLALNMIKQRIMKKPVAQMSVAEKERVEKILEKRKALIDRLAMRLTPRMRRIESDRLSHQKTSGSAPAPGM